MRCEERRTRVRGRVVLRDSNRMRAVLAPGKYNDQRTRLLRRRLVRMGRLQLTLRSRAAPPLIPSDGASRVTASSNMAQANRVNLALTRRTYMVPDSRVDCVYGQERCLSPI